MDSLIFVSLFLFGLSSAARLDNAYLPPRGSAGSGAGLLSSPGIGGGYFGAGGGSYSHGAGGGSFGPGRYSGGGGYSQPAGPVIPIIQYENNPNQGDGSYGYSYGTGNGIQAAESGRVAGEESGTAAHGQYSYTGEDGQTYTITYTADENGFQAQGAHLPTPPPIPEAILKSLEYNAANPQSEFNTGGSYPGPSGAYGAPSQSYSRPSGSYGAPSQSYSRPSGGYLAPSQSYARPSGGFGGSSFPSPSSAYGAPAHRAPPSFSPSSGYHYRK